MKRRSVVLALALITLGFLPSLVDVAQSAGGSDSWLISVDEAKKLIANGAVVLDSRDAALIKRNPLSNAIAANWQEWSQFSPKHPSGLLLEDENAMTQKFQAAGVSAERPVVCIADPKNGWGEDGRVVWVLRTFGHARAYMVNGGYQALTREGAPKIAKAVIPGDFIARRTSGWEATRDEVRANMNKPDVVLVDAREPREYGGKTPYGESRGGHVPGAIHVYYKDLYDKSGYYVRSPAELDAFLASKGLSKDKKVIAYCTGGVRSGFLTAVLASYGYSVKNYAGSMWDWAEQPAASFPLERK
ncbi:MAG: sulfurtransferase [Deltaproteobacteria bacterium]|nr:sulfurtransferase [Deltaproteobacteria bacterium]